MRIYLKRLAVHIVFLAGLMLLSACSPPSPAAQSPAPGGESLSETAQPGGAGESPLTSEEVVALTDAWANALKSHDGDERGEIASAALKAQYTGAVIGDPDFLMYNYVGEANSEKANASIVYYLMDKFGNKYIRHEKLTFQREDGRPAVAGCETSPVLWERKYSFFPTAEKAYYAMTEAIFWDDYYGALSIAHAEEYSEELKAYFVKTAFTGLTIVSFDIRSDKAAFQVTYRPQDKETLEISPDQKTVWFLFVKDDRGWYGEKMMYDAAPDAAWWSAPVGQPVWVKADYDPKKVITDAEFTLPNGISFGMTYDEAAAALGGAESGYQHSVGLRIIEDRGIRYVFYDRDGRYVLTNINANASEVLFKPSEAGILRGIKLGDSLLSVLDKIPARNRKLQKWAQQQLYGNGYATKNSAVLEYGSSSYTIRIFADKCSAILYFDKNDRLWDIELNGQ